MLNTPPDSAIPVTPPPAARPGAGPARSRGARPGNANARKHGLYATPDPHPIAPFLDRAREIATRGRQGPETIPEGVDALRHIASAVFDQLNEVDPFTPAHSALLNQLLRTVTKIQNLNLLYHSLGAEQRRLSGLASQVSFLVKWEFRFNRIPVYPLFVPHSFENLSHLSTYCRGLDPSGAFLTDRHWFILKPLLTGLHAEREEEARIYGRPRPRRSPYPDRFVLDGVLWKLATACRWDDLPPVYPVRRCQRLYRELYNTGRMAAIYEGLRQDLLVYGDTTLEALIETGQYRVLTGKIIYIPKGTPDWQYVVALLLLQRAYFNFRKLMREGRAARLRRGKYLRLPPLPNPRPRSGRRKRKRPPLPPGTFTVPPAHNHPAFRRPRLVPPKESFAWAKWIALQARDQALHSILEDP